MSTHEEIQDTIRENYPFMHKSNAGRALSYAAGMLNEIRLMTSDLNHKSDEHDIAEVALEGILKRLRGEAVDE